MALTPIGTVTGFSGAIEKPSHTYGSYDFKLAFTGDNAREMWETIDGLMAESLAKWKSKGNAKPPYTRVDDALVVTFRRKAEITAKDGTHYNFNVKIFDSNGKPVEEILNIGEGTDLIVSYNPYMWDVKSQGGCGVTLQPDKIQVVNLVKYEGGSDSNPFEEVEWTHKDVYKGGKDAVASSENNDGDDGDF